MANTTASSNVPDVHDDQDDRSSDEDFDPSAAPGADEAADAGADDDSESSSDEDKGDGGAARAAATKKRGRKRARPAAAAAINGELDSGDEATLRESRRKRARRGEGAAWDAADEGSSGDEGAVGGFVRTRAQRRNGARDARPLASMAGATIDVDDAWARLAALPVGRPTAAHTPTEPSEAAPRAPDAVAGAEDEYITIRRTTRFAGELSTEQKRVPRHSAEARIYLAEQAERRKRRAAAGHDGDGTDEAEDGGEAPQPVDGEDAPPPLIVLRRPLKRPSRFEPNPAGDVRSLPPHLQLRWPRVAPSVAAADASGLMLPPPPPDAAGSGRRRHSQAPAAAVGATKLNTVEKSRHDWAGYVDKTGIAHELDEYGRSKASYLGREEFLARTESRVEQERREARFNTAA